MPSGKQESATEVTTGESSQVEVVTEQGQSVGGSTAKADRIDKVVTINEQGVDLKMMLTILASVAGFSLILGMVIPQPRFIKWFW